MISSSHLHLQEISIALELCECGSARDLFARVGFRPVPEIIIAPIARGLLAALHYLHDIHVMHRDVKAGMKSKYDKERERER